ncbi:hypothetical protein Lal_00022896 [Lupinus albus]|nr:hypothetical protein Lal_00022896 [Lupinus albus]
MSEPRFLMVKTTAKRPRNMEGANTFLEMKGKIYPSLVREFYNNFQYKEEVYISLVSGKFITLDSQLFMDVGGLSSTGLPLGDCENELWNSFDAVEMYKSCLHGPHFFVPSD